MPKIARIHNNPNTNVQGIDRSDVVNPATMFQGVPDPLLEGGSMLASKVGSSIPNMFARMVFFKTAFSSIRQVNIPQGADIPEYNRLVSQCLDLLEMLFNGNQNIKPVNFDFANQIALLRNSHWDAHRHFAAVLEEQRSQSIPDIQSLYLFVDNENKIIGGTSPFTMVYTSPNWDSGLPVRSLQERKDDTFKQFVYRLVAAYTTQGVITANSPFSAFSNYVRAIANAEHQNFVGYTEANLQTDYDVYRDGNNIVYCAAIPVYKRKAGEFSSDFFIHATRMQFDRNTTPLALTNGPHPGMYYYDTVLWSQNIEVPQVGRSVYRAIDDQNLILPGCDAHRHDFITDIDIFEEKLVALPYPIDSGRFGKTIAIDDKYNALLPIRPIYFLYFSVEDLDNQLTITRGADYCELALSMPVFDGGSRNNTIVFRKRYDFTSDVQYLMVKGTQTSFNVGISPFYKLPVKTQNNYWIMGAIDDVSRFSMQIKFYRHGQRTDYENPNGLNTLSYIERSRAPQTFYANIVHFDVMQIELTEKQNQENKVRCILLPHFLNVPNNGIQQFYYGIDFGTTNSHVAYESDSTDHGSFSEKEYATAVTYLNVTDTVVNNVPIYHEDTLRLNKAREFYPQQSSRYDCTFPIRTAISISGALDAGSQLFGNASIGFHFGKEIISQPFYETKLKWNLMNDPASAAAQSAVRIFFYEILLMIRHHWMSQTNADHNRLPKIRITFPKFSPGATAMTRMWENAYQSVFGVMPNPANNLLTTMVESLAPCVQSIHTGGMGLITGGLLNMDIGGGTTDIQYYKQVGQRLDSRYDSILFAGDDLWGQDFENMSPLINSAAIKPNNFTNVARTRLGNAAIRIDNADTNIGSITLNGKELINCLFRDQNNNFSTVLSDVSGGTDVRKCRMQMTMHYSAIIYHIANWLKVNELTIPSILRASGLGSKYLSLLFPEDNLATAYTRYLFEKFWPAGSIPTNFKVEITNNQGINPKVITAEGAALSLKTGVNLTAPIKSSHLGMADYTVGYQFGGHPIQVGDTNDAGVQKSAEEYFDTFVDTMCSLNLNTDVPAVAGVIPTLTADECANMKENGLRSIQTIATSYYNSQAHRADNLDESMMVWALKDSLWKL